MRFVYSVRTRFLGGNGGNGCISMLRLYANEFGGPDGGNGGNGGHVILRANNQIKSLNNIARQYRGQDGSPGHGKCLFGAAGEHTLIDVPLGTRILPGKPKDLAEHEFTPDKSDILAELDEPGSMFIAARGGAGGRGNASYLSQKNRHPRVAEMGAKGEMSYYELRMKIFAHVGLIGLPNVGKSTLLHTLTRAQVKIADYSFTTMFPQVGTIEYDDYTQLAISDLPGLIEDSHKNRGLGLSFLRSLGHCACLLFVVDLSDKPISQFETLVSELELHKKGMSWRPHLIWGNKVDKINVGRGPEEFAQYLASRRPASRLIVGSGLRGDNLEVLKHELRRLHDEYQQGHDDLLDYSLKW